MVEDFLQLEEDFSDSFEFMGWQFDVFEVEESYQVEAYNKCLSLLRSDLKNREQVKREIEQLVMMLGNPTIPHGWEFN